MKQTKAQLEYMNNVLDGECQKLMHENNLLKGIISLLLKQSEETTKVFKISEPDRIYIKIENEICTIIRECNGVNIDEIDEVNEYATMQTEN